MNTSEESAKIEEFVRNLIGTRENLFLIEVKITPANKVTVLLDGDNGVTIDDCTKVNKALYKFIEENNLFGGDFSLEVSSAGVDKPLKLLRQYKKNIGRKVKVTLIDGGIVEGKLTDVTTEDITIKEKTGKGNKIIMNKTTILFNQIKDTTVLITF
jgi:ribosome maturation factor RimP